MSDADPELEAGDTPDDQPDLALADPEDYHRSRRLKEIHRARERVHDVVQELEISESDGSAVYVHSITELAHAVAMYATELRPLMEQLDLDDEALELPEFAYHDDVIHFTQSMGLTGDGPARRMASMKVFQKCNAVLADAKPLIETDETDEWEV